MIINFKIIYVYYYFHHVELNKNFKLWEFSNDIMTTIIYVKSTCYEFLIKHIYHL